ncbi:MAG: menaquinone biosynthesis protein, partial [Daejeonella sp.]|nr:menaquinone biosynthesis protein [Daejeonella sp.]
ISNYCIGANGAVNSVFIFSDRPIEEIKVLNLDPQSRTSNNLAKVLLKNYWKLNPELKASDKEEHQQAFVEIGDRTFGKHDHYPFTYDLAEEWLNYTGLPFVFAVWASNKILPEKFISSFNKALEYGLNHRKEVISNLPTFKNFDLDNYLMERIDFNLDLEKQKALTMFLGLVKALDE